MERLLSLQGVYEQRLEEAAVPSFSLNQKYIELRQRLRPTEDHLAVTSGAASPEPLPLRPGVRGGFRPVATGTPIDLRPLPGHHAASTSRRAHAPSQALTQEAAMAIAAVFEIPGMTDVQYDRIIEGLEAAGVGAPDGRLYHVAAPSDNGWLVVDIWQSEEQLGRFANVLMPIAADAGAAPPAPRVYPVHNIIVG